MARLGTGSKFNGVITVNYLLLEMSLFHDFFISDSLASKRISTRHILTFEQVFGTLYSGGFEFAMRIIKAFFFKSNTHDI